MNTKVSAAYEHVQSKIRRQECVILDGAIATELQARGARDFRLTDSEHWGFEALRHAPKTVADVHKAYVEVGCDVITTNTYGVLAAPTAGGSIMHQGAPPLHWIDLVRKAVALARDATALSGRGEECAVAFSIGGDVATDEHLKTVKLLLRTLNESPPDLVLFETLTMLQDNRTRDAIALLLDAGLPVWLSFRRCREGVCGVHGQLWGGPEGDYFGRLAAEMEELGVGALLINCLPAYRVSGTLPWLSDFTDLPLGVYPNLGRYVDPEWKFDDDISPEDYADLALIWRAEGAQILGGCCGVRPAHLAAMAEAVRGTRPNAPIGQIGAPGANQPPAPAERLYDTLQTVEVDPWRDQHGRQLYPLPLPEIRCDPEVFVPTQGSYLVWKYLFKEGIGAGRRCLDVGCGAGLLSIQLALNGADHVTAMDIQKAAVANTLTNAFRNGVNDRVHGQVADLYTFAPENKYDIVVASLYQMPTDPLGNLSGHRPVDYWGRNLLDHLISVLPKLLDDQGTAYIMQISLLSQFQTERLLREAGFRSRVLDYNLYQFAPIFLENLKQIQRVEEASDAYHFAFQDDHVMVMYLIEARKVAGQPG